MIASAEKSQLCCATMLPPYVAGTMRYPHISWFMGPTHRQREDMVEARKLLQYLLAADTAQALVTLPDVDKADRRYGDFPHQCTMLMAALSILLRMCEFPGPASFRVLLAMCRMISPRLGEQLLTMGRSVLQISRQFLITISSAIRSAASYVFHPMNSIAAGVLGPNAVSVRVLPSSRVRSTVAPFTQPACVVSVSGPTLSANLRTNGASRVTLRIPYALVTRAAKTLRVITFRPALGAGMLRRHRGLPSVVSGRGLLATAPRPLRASIVTEMGGRLTWAS